MTLASAPPAPPVTRTRWAALAVLSLAVLVTAIDMTVLSLAVPHLVEDLEPDAGQLLWISDIYGFVIAGLLVTMGSLGDRIGRKRLLLIGSAAFAAASALAAFAPSAEALIAGRALMGVAGATLMPSTLSLLRSTFVDPRERTFAIGIWSAMAAAGAAVGPLVGGALLERFWWGSVLLINVPVMAVILVAGVLVLRESRDPAPGPLDLLSALLSVMGVVGLVYGLKKLALDGLGRTDAWVALLVGAAVLVWFVRRQLRSASPLIDVRLFRIPAFGGAVAANLVAVFGLMGGLFFVAQLLQLVRGLSPMQAGLQLLPLAAGAIAAALLVSGRAHRTSPRALVGGGLVLASLGMLALAVAEGVEGPWALGAAMLALGAGVGATMTVTADSVLAAVPPAKAGAGAAVNETAYELGGALGIAMLGAVGTAVYARSVDLPDGLPPEVLVAASDTLGAALVVSGLLDSATAAQVVEAARSAFIAGARASAVVAAGALAVAALVAARTLPSRPVRAVDH
jgi:DHA2 family multidrug resistance protein-like MFS transporter